MKNRIQVTMDEVEDGTLGVCLACGEIAEGVEPDARGYECDCCEKKKVYGLEEAVLMGFVDVSEG